MSLTILFTVKTCLTALYDNEILNVFVTCFLISQILVPLRLIINCSTGQAYTISLNDTDNGSAEYILQNTTTGISSTGHQLLVSFAKSTGGAMTSGAATITGTGIGAADTLSTSIVGTIASGQSGKSAGSYSKTMTLNLVY